MSSQNIDKQLAILCSNYIQFLHNVLLSWMFSQYKALLTSQLLSKSLFLAASVKNTRSEYACFWKMHLFQGILYLKISISSKCLWVSLSMHYNVHSTYNLMPAINQLVISNYCFITYLIIIIYFFILSCCILHVAQLCCIALLIQ